MRHNVKRSGLRKTRGWYKALRKNLLTSLFKHDKIKTTEARAKTIKPLAEKIVATVKRKEERDAIRYLKTYITEEDVSKKIIKDSKEKFATKNSGFVSIAKIGVRDGDAAPLVQIELK
jgi:large subunit ribosomal protein L17